MDWYFLDSCSLLNLAASGRLAQIAKTLELRFSVIPKVYPNESQFVHQRDGRVRLEAVALDLSDVVQAGIIHIEADLTPAELELYLEFIDPDNKNRIDDGEAMTAASAIHRKAGLVTDDRKARRVILERVPTMQIISSMGLVRMWAEKNGIARPELIEVFENIEICARYTIGKRDAEFDWYKKITEG
ncbi:MAG: hypothetical protein RLZZ156_1868 [Deinococcota bacterium]